MNTGPKNAGITRQATITLPSDREIVISRDFDAPAQLVFDAHTKPELLQQWYGLRSATSTACEIDFRVGGRWRSAQTFPGMDDEVAFSGEFQEIDAPVRYVYTEMFEAQPGPPAVVTMTFAERDGRTTVTSHSVFDSVEIRDLVLQSGMEHGANEMFSRLDDLLASP
jgi:uncharacterized protein YndB with AHSA1/START domain